MAVSEKSRNFATVKPNSTKMKMKDKLCKWVITGVNVLTGARDELSRPMEREQAEERLEREKQSRSRQRYQPYKRIRVEKQLPTQLTIRFKED